MPHVMLPALVPFCFCLLISSHLLFARLLPIPFLFPYQLGDIIKFYNEIFVPATKAFLLKLGHSSEYSRRVKAFE